MTPLDDDGSDVRHAYDFMLLRNGSHDPTTRVFVVLAKERAAHSTPSRLVAHIQRASLTPHGPGSVSIDVSGDGTHTVTAWGPGGSWLAERAERLSAHATPFSPIVARHEAVRRAVREVGHLHLPASDTPYHEVLPAILGQRITAAQALRQWALLCDRYGDVAPGPLGLRLPPAPERLLAVPSWDFHRLGIEEQRAKTLRTAARHAPYIDRTRDLDPSAARTALMKLPGIGVWTAAVSVGVSHGDADAVPFGDFHVKNTVSWALHGRPRGTDEEMEHSLAAYPLQRWQVVRTLERAGFVAPRFGPGRRLLDVARL